MKNFKLTVVATVASLCNKPINEDKLKNVLSLISGISLEPRSHEGYLKDLEEIWEFYDVTPTDDLNTLIPDLTK